MLEAWEIPFQSEVGIEVNGRKYRIDFQVEYKGSGVFLEIDGNSHYSEEGANTRIAYQKELTPKQVYMEKLNRDSTLETWAASNGIPMVRVFSYSLSKLTKEQFLSLLDVALLTGGTHSRVATKGNLIEMSQYLSISELLQYFNIGEPTLQKLRYKFDLPTSPSVKLPKPDWLAKIFPDSAWHVKAARNRTYYDQSFKSEFVQLRKEMTNGQLQKHLGVSSSTLANLLVHHNLQRPKSAATSRKEA